MALYGSVTDSVTARVPDRVPALRIPESTHSAVLYRVEYRALSMEYSGVLRPLPSGESSSHDLTFGAIVLVWAADRLARSTRHFLEVLDELNHLNVEFVSFREQLDTGGPLGRAVVVIISAIAELERSLIVERVRAGLRRAKLEGRRIGRPPINVDRAAVLADRRRGLSLTQISRAHRISRATVSRILRTERASSKSLATPLRQTAESARPESAA